MREYKLVCEEQRTIYKELFNFFVNNYERHSYYKNHEELKWFSEYELEAYQNSKEYTLKQDFVNFLRANNMHILSENIGKSELNEKQGIYINPTYEALSESEQKELYKLDLEDIRRNITLSENAFIKASLRDDKRYFSNGLTLYNQKGILQLEEPQVEAQETIEKEFQKVKLMD